jgi:Fe-S cluster biosynthesis and repair protein YggX
MTLTCERCKNPGEAPPPARVAFMGAQKERILAGICTSCWKEWEGTEIKVINEYRLNFMDPEHREVLKKACADFLGLGGAGRPGR